MTKTPKRSAEIVRSDISPIDGYDLEREKENAAAAMAMLSAFKQLGAPKSGNRLSCARATIASLHIAPEPDPDVSRSVREFREALRVSLAELAAVLAIPVFDLTRLEETDISFFTASAMRRWLDAIRSLAHEEEDITAFVDVAFSVLASPSQASVSGLALAESADEIIEDDSLVSNSG